MTHLIFDFVASNVRGLLFGVLGLAVSLALIAHWSDPGFFPALWRDAVRWARERFD